MTDKKNKPPFYLIDTTADFYRPLGTRIAICVAAALWAALEIWHQQGFWGVIAGAVAVYCVYVLFLTYHPPAKPAPPAPSDEPGEDDGEEVVLVDETVETMVDRFLAEDKSWEELIKEIRKRTECDIFSAEKIAFAHAGWRRRCNTMMNLDQRCGKRAASHIKIHGPQSLVTIVDGQYVAVEPTPPVEGTNPT